MQNVKQAEATPDASVDERSIQLDDVEQMRACRVLWGRGVLVGTVKYSSVSQ